MDRRAWMAGPLALVLATGADALAQEHQPGELFLKTFIGGIGGHGAIGHLDRQSGVFTELVTLPGSSPNGGDFGNGCLAWDPQRQMLITMFRAAPTNDFGLHAMDAQGLLTQLASLGTGSAGWSLSPTGDGRIYFLHGRSMAPLEPIRWLDAANVLHTLTDAATGQPYVPQHSWVLATEAMIYEPQTNALFFATVGNVNAGCTGGPTQLTVHKAPLSPDGTQVVGPIGCTQIDVFGSVSSPTGWDVLPNGRLLLTTSGAAITVNQARFFEVDPVTLGVSTFAVPSVWTTCAGTWSEVEQKALTLDYSQEKLRGYAAGAGGLLLLGFSPSAVPLLGGTLHLSPIASSFTISAGGTPGGPGTGSFALPLFFGPGLVGLTFYLQAGFLDAGAVQGVSRTNGLAVTIG